jgi:predicted RNA-binding protein YlqC (UPF0109 family)
MQELLQTPQTAPETTPNMTDSELRLLRGRMKLWLRETVMLMVDRPQDVKVMEGSARINDTQLKVLCAAADTGKVIGTGGRNVRSLRTVMLSVSRATHHNFTLDVVDANEGKREERMARVMAAAATQQRTVAANQ